MICARCIAFLAVFGGVLFLSFSAQAEVFSLGPSDSESRGFDPLNAPMNVWDEPVLINGYETELNVNIYRNNIGDALYDLQRRFPNLKIQNLAGSYLCETMRGSQRMRRLFVQLNKLLVEFIIPLPGTLPAPSWPAKIPKISGVTPISTIEFPKRGTASVTFGSGTPAHLLATDAVQQIVAKGWIEGSASSSRELQNGGGVLLSEDGKHLLSIEVNTVPNTHQSIGTIVQTRIKE